MKILVVDDEVDQVESLRRGLRSKGHHVLEALSAPQALNFLRDSRMDIDLVITDYSMPGMDGIELLESVRRSHGSMPVIMMTAYGQKDLVIRALHQRCNGFIEKPFVLADLIHEIEQTLANLSENSNRNELSEMLPMLVHQINNPLAAISGSVELVMLSLNNPEAVKRFLHTINAAAEQIRNINNEILGTARQGKLEAELLDIVDVINSSLDIFEELLALRAIPLQRQLPGAPALIIGHRFDLIQLFNNLILNAIEAMEKKQQDVLLRIALAVREDSSVYITVEDKGCGIPGNLVESIYSPYFTNKKAGTGLGLAVVKKVVEKHRGAIRVDSVVGEGTKFTVIIPGIPNKKSVEILVV